MVWLDEAGEARRTLIGGSRAHEARTLLLIALACIASGAIAAQPSPSPAASPEPTPIPFTNILIERQSAMTSLQEMGEGLSSTQSSAQVVADDFGSLTGEIDPRMAEDTQVLQASPSLDMLYRTKLTWQDFGENLSALSKELTRRVVDLDEELDRSKGLEKSWQVTLEAAKKENVPASSLQSIQGVVDSIQQTRQAIEARRSDALNLLTQISDEQTRVHRTLSMVEQAQIRALKDLFVRDSPFIWKVRSSLTKGWANRCGTSVASQFEASTAFGKRLPLSFLVHAILLVALSIGLRWMRGGVRKLAVEKPDLNRALPVLDLPVATAFVLSVLLSPLVYPQAPRLIHALLAMLALVPAVLILRRLLDRSLSPLLYFLVAMFFIDQVRVVVVSVPELARFLFLGQMLGGFLFLLWLFRSRILRTTAEKTSARFAKTLRFITTVGLLFFATAVLANIFGYVDLAHLVGMIYLRSLYVAALLYTAVRILEGLLVIGLEVRPLGSLRVVSLHRQMLHKRACWLFEFLAVLCWLNLMLGFFGLVAPVTTAIETALKASVTIGSISLSLGSVIAFLIAIWASFLISRFVRFVLEEDVYHRLFLERGIPYAISTMLHYAILLIGFFLALGALGIDLTKITILAGAFSVGIGFGLQNVINNFVSGLILLFERPIKIGDIIEVGGNAGEVRRIGIRASIIRTSDGSEVIVPNGSLISSQVTNWTLSDRGRAVELSVNVAGSTDLHRVTELLKKIAADHPDVAKEPAPRVIVTSMSASAVTFQLRVWTERIEAWAEVRSDLSFAINETLAREKIVLA